jgi:signal transduction histidine kinase
MDTVLDSAAMSNGRLIQQFHPAATALDRLVREAVEHVQSQSSRHTLTVELPPVPLLVSGDRVRLRHVLDNLLANAVKYSPDGGAILVRLEAVEAPPTMLPNPPLALPERTPGGPHWALLRVKDEGLGIPAEAVPHVFERYWRADGPTRLIPGTGLGLFACSMIVAAHGGHIWVEESIPAMDLESEPSRPHGTTMALVLPLATLPGGAAAAIDGLNGQDHAAAQDEDEIDGERGEIDGK